MMEEDSTVVVRIRKITLDEINKLIIRNPVFETPADVIAFAIKEIMKGIKK